MLVLAQSLLLVMLVGANAEAAQSNSAARCALPEPRVLRQDGNTIFQLWELPATPIWFSETLPDALGYAAYRAAIRGAGGDVPRPIFDRPPSTTDEEREVWRREEENFALMYSEGGQVRPIRCLEAALFAFQDARYSELTTPTEFIAQLLRRGDRLKVYFGASDTPVPPKSVYGFEAVAIDVAAGWEYLAVLHNHTVQTLDGKPVLGVPAPSTSDVPLFRGVAKRFGLREVWVTNGMYTGVVRGEDLARFRGRD